MGGGGSGVYNSGGGGGYTKTEKLPVTPRQSISVEIGAGGSTGSNYNFTNGESGYGVRGSAGGKTRIDDISALGGNGGNQSYHGYIGSDWFTDYNGGSGGSGGGAANNNQHSGRGGSNGGDGDGGYSQGYDRVGKGIGQHTTTRAFADPAGTLYSDGGSAFGGACEANTGNGSGGKSYVAGSGIAIIRWGY